MLFAEQDNEARIRETKFGASS
ncbi:hypothetical protein SBA5_140065 [Candidatus Sulfotelmatomonas gaucii]|uniref:Uncharacterized protein n=1 Tax=Candidatus Sulfuritelmatomonas gaucii TaxID=2043161 RepID=A0A2N9L4I5_9BACT|nr:hypothetical protein SBA5_140065 [Candidatus Sulfotelmatomonas gaucii]